MAVVSGARVKDTDVVVKKPGVKKKDRMATVLEKSPVERAVIVKLVRQEMREEAAKIVGEQLEKAKKIDAGWTRMVEKMGVRKKVVEEQVKVVGELAWQSDLAFWQTVRVLRRWGLEFEVR